MAFSNRDGGTGVRRQRTGTGVRMEEVACTLTRKEGSRIHYLIIKLKQKITVEKRQKAILKPTVIEY